MATVAYKCPSCGAGIGFNAELQLFKCEYCCSEYTEEQIAAQAPDDAHGETSKTSDEENEEFCNEFLSYTCKNCGAEVFADEHTAAEICYYCHQPVVCDGRLSGQLKPRFVIPFAYDKAEAENMFLKFAKSKWFVPRDFFAKKQVEKIQGIYYPFWLTDVDVSASRTANAQNVRTWKVGKNLYTETSHYKLYRAGDIHFEDVTTGAFDAESKAMLEGILPYPNESLKDFAPTYLSGFIAKKRTVEHADIIDEVKKQVSEYSGTLLAETMRGYNSIQPQGTQVKLNKILGDYSLLPIWVLTYKKGEKIYTYAMNGYTGKIYGELPISGKKLWLLFAIVSLGITLLGTLGGLLL
ncbi:MAG: TFIIB-type zinc ribbon-containing protein [Ruminococcaceae bacterium]|nr:TFIIB-type zinc ribbon-containing protein [Oscillospiraceae bacterium]